VAAAEIVHRLAEAGVTAGSRRGLVRLSPAADVPLSELCNVLSRVLSSL
jgi:hypothetical protein